MKRRIFLKNAEFPDINSYFSFRQLCILRISIYLIILHKLQTGWRSKNAIWIVNIVLMEISIGYRFNRLTDTKVKQKKLALVGETRFRN